MKVLFVSELKETDVCGVTVHIKNLMEGLNQLGNETDFISVSSIPKPIQLCFVSFPTIFLKHISLDIRWIWPYIFYQIYFNFLIAYKQLTHHYDIVNAQALFSYNSTALLRLFYNIPVVLTEHSYRSDLIEGRGLNRNGFAEKYIIANKKKAIKSAKAIVSVDSRIKEYLIAEYGADFSKISTKINFVNVNEFKPRKEKAKYRKMFDIPEKKLTVLCPRRLVPKNGVKYAALAAIYLKKEYKNDFQIIFTGEGNEEKEIKAIMDEHSLQENILILKVVPHNQMTFLYNACDIVVIPSINYFGLEEATSLSALEAMSSGIPTIASNVGGLKEIIHDYQTGFLITEKNPELIANKIIEINNIDTQKIVDNAKLYVANNASHLKRANEFLNIYNSVIYGKIIGKKS